MAHSRIIVLTAVGVSVLAIGPAALGRGGPPVDEFEHNAGGWLATVSGEALHAFDQFNPGVAAASSCLGGTPGTSLYLTGGVVTVSAFDELDRPECAVTDGSTTPAVSDALLTGPPGEARLVLGFSPPISAFYTYYGSLAIGETVTMDLFSNGSFVESLESDQSFDDVDAAGHGFVSDVLVDRIEFTSTDGGGVLIGAFVGLLGGEGSLGTVVIPGYAGPNGEAVEYDFGLVFAPDCNDNGVHDAIDIAMGDSIDSNGNAQPDECEFSGTLSGAVTWAGGTTVYVGSDLIVTGSLTIEAGVDVTLEEGAEIRVDLGALLDIQGTEAQPVRLRPVGGDRWDGIRFLGGSGDLRWAELERLRTHGILVAEASPTIDQCIIRDVAPPSGGASGIVVQAGSNPRITYTLIQGVTGASASGPGGNGTNGNNGSNGAAGGGSQACTGGGFNGANGGGATAGGAGSLGQIGGDAYGAWVQLGGSLQMASCRITDLHGGNGATGGNGGLGGSGGDGGNGTGGVFCGGSGGNGAIGRPGGAGADGREGGDAIGLLLEEPASSAVVQNVISHLLGGNGGNGGNGRNGGSGGDGGDGASNVFSGGDGGNGANGGVGGAAGDGGNAGRAMAISVLNHASSIVLSQNTVGGGFARGTPGVAGARGTGGAGGAAGAGAGSGGSNGSGGGNGALGALGVAGAPGSAVGVHADSGPSPVITASNNIVAPGSPAYSIGMQAANNAVVVGDFNCFDDFASMVVGGVAPGGGSFVADPAFVDADGADDLPGTEDDDRRLAPGSPCIDTGGDGEIPDDAADLDGDANTSEPLPLDADGNPRIIAASVDIGAYEFGSAAPPCPWDLDDDGIVGITDLLSLLANWGAPWGITDLLDLLSTWGACP